MGKSKEEVSGDSLWMRPVCLFVCLVDIFNMDLGSGGKDGPRGLNEPQQNIVK